jgi:tetratricopeptide (TPR) repeat protein
MANAWYIAFDEWYRKAQMLGTSLDDVTGDLYKVASEAVGSSSELLASEMTPEKYVDVYTRLLDAFPDVDQWHHRRAINFGKLCDWEKAAADAARAVELNNNSQRSWQAMAAFALQAGDKTMYERACEGQFDHHAHAKDGPRVPMDRVYARANVVISACLGPSRMVGSKELAEIVESLPSTDHTQIRTAQGMFAYRHGQYAEALALLPNEVSGGTRNALPLVFKAMACQRLNQADEAQSWLRRAREEMARSCPSPDGPMRGWEEYPVCWSEIDFAMDEAEELIPLGSRTIEGNAE